MKIVTAPFPLRFRTHEEANAYMRGEISAGQLPQPFIEIDGQIVRNKEYDDAPFEQGFLVAAT